MTAEDLADLLRDAYDRAKPHAWHETDDDPARRFMPRVRQRWLAVVRDVRERLEADKRDVMAAGLLVGLMQSTALMVGPGGEPLTSDEIRNDLMPSAVALTDGLRAELAKPTAAEASEIRLLREVLSCVVGEGWVDVERAAAKMAPDVYAAMGRAPTVSDETEWRVRTARIEGVVMGLLLAMGVGFGFLALEWLVRWAR